MHCSKIKRLSPSKKRSTALPIGTASNDRRPVEVYKLWQHSLSCWDRQPSKQLLQQCYPTLPFHFGHYLGATLWCIYHIFNASDPRSWDLQADWSHSAMKTYNAAELSRFPWSQSSGWWWWCTGYQRMGLTHWKSCCLASANLGEVVEDIFFSLWKICIHMGWLDSKLTASEVTSCICC